MSSASQDAWRNQLHSHAPWLRTVLRARIRHDNEIEDLLQDIFTDALRVPDPHKHVHQTGPWLYRIAIRKILQVQRKQARRRRTESHYCLRQQHRGDELTSEPLARLLRDEQRDLVRTALGRLDGQAREVLLLKYEHNWNYQEIGEHLGITHNKVTHRLRRARCQLRVHLAGLLSEAGETHGLPE